VEVIFQDENVLVQSLKDMGYNVEIHDNGILIGNNYGHKKLSISHVVVRKNQFGGMGDIGFERTTKGFVMHADGYDAGKYGGAFGLKELNKIYVENKLKKYLSTTSTCNIFSRRENEKGQIEIQLTVT
jgi:hypothetical protein